MRPDRKPQDQNGPGRSFLGRYSRTRNPNVVSFEQGFGSNSTLFASMYAVDALGAASRATFGVVVSAYEGEVEDLGNLVDEYASEALEAGDTDTVMQVGSIQNNDSCFGL